VCWGVRPKTVGAGQTRQPLGPRRDCRRGQSGARTVRGVIDRKSAFCQSGLKARSAQFGSGHEPVDDLPGRACVCFEAHPVASGQALTRRGNQVSRLGADSTESWVGPVVPATTTGQPDACPSSKCGHVRIARTQVDGQAGGESNLLGDRPRSPPARSPAARTEASSRPGPRTRMRGVIRPCAAEMSIIWLIAADEARWRWLRRG